jgi:hypothetical protein
VRKKIQHEWVGRFPTMDLALRHAYEKVTCYEADGWGTQSTHVWDSGPEANQVWGPGKRFSVNIKFSKTVDIESPCP